VAPVSRIYASLPLDGPQGRFGRELLRGAELALERLDDPPTELVVLDSFEGQASGNARRAAGDEGALAYLGDFGSPDVLESAPVLGEAGLLAVAPVATFAGLSGPTLVRLMPHDGVGARAIAGWLAEAGVGELLVVHDHDSILGRYSIDEHGHTTATAYGRLAVAGGELVWDRERRG
jgi:ABC-type branched-subunit amino acid transport system substrate-binding protein